MKYARIEICRTGDVRVIIPMRYSDASLKNLLSEREPWIRKSLAKLQESKIAVADTEILYLGKKIQRTLFTTGDEKWYRVEAAKYIAARLQEISTKFGFRYNKVFIRGGASNWGSCSSSKNLSFNWRLMQAPPEVIDYVIVHELVHTEIMDHSKRFWSRVAEIYPDFKTQRAWLKKYGHNLQ